MPVEVFLTAEEMAEAASVGAARQIDSLRRKSTAAYGFNGNAWGIHVLGALGEQAVAKCLDIEWDKGVGTYGAPDVGRYQVRTSADYNGKMAIRQKDRDSEVFIFVTGTGPEFYLHGWIRAYEAKQHSEWIEDKGNRGFPAWFVPKDALKPMNKLPEYKRKLRQ